MPQPSTKLPSLAFEIFREFGGSTGPLRDQKVLLACSGGLDSVVLVDVFSRLAKRWNLELAIAHVHHGRTGDADVDAFRAEARSFAKALAADFELPFHDILFESLHSEEAPPKSEAALRRFRLIALEGLRQTLEFDRVAFAHHADDLFETRVMRLIRGTGGDGLRAMKPLAGRTVRPFLRVAKARLRHHALTHELSWVEDVSNRDSRYFRNWIRETWLPLLESRRPGSSTSFARSLEVLAQSAAPDEAADGGSSFDRLEVNRLEFDRLTTAEKQVQVARMGRQFEAKDFGTSRIGEVLKRLARLETTHQKSTSFQVGGLVWKIDPRQITVSKA